MSAYRLNESSILRGAFDQGGSRIDRIGFVSLDHKLVGGSECRWGRALFTRHLERVAEEGLRIRSCVLTNRDFGRMWWRAKVQGESCGKNDNPTSAVSGLIIQLAPTIINSPHSPWLTNSREVCSLMHTGDSLYSITGKLGSQRRLLDHHKDVIQQDFKNRRRVSQLGHLIQLMNSLLTHNFTEYGSQSILFPNHERQEHVAH
jgi:hypothetical protein